VNAGSIRAYPFAALRVRWRRAALYATLALLTSGCVPVGARWQNMFSALGLLG
jgi:hypothetical protein